MFVKYLAAAAAVALVTPAAFAATETLDFESYSAGDVVSEVFVGGIRGDVFIVTDTARQAAATTGNAAVLDSNDAFDVNNPADGDPDLAAPFYDAFDANGNPLQGAGELNPGNVLIIEEDPNADSAADTYADDSAKGGRIIFTFDDAVNFAGFTVLDDVKNMIVRGFRWDEQLQTNVRVGQVGKFSMANDNQFRTFDVDWRGVTRLSFNFKKASGAIDDLRFNLPPVPVPASLPLLLAGLGGFAMMRRRKKA